MRIRILTSWSMLAGTLAGAACAQVVGPETPVGARNTSLANANLSEFADVSVMYQNPAPLAFLENRSLFLNHSQASAPQALGEHLAFLAIPPGPVAVAIGFAARHQGYLSSTAPVTRRFVEYGFDVALAARITSTLSIGTFAGGRESWTHSPSKAWGVRYSVGAAYAPIPDVSYSIVLGGLGRDVSYTFVDSATIVSSAALRKTLTVGATMCYPRPSSLRPPIVMLSLANEKTFGSAGLVYRGGIALRPVDFLELRFGYVLGPDEHSARYGIGLLMKSLAVQYGVCPLQDSGVWLQQISASVVL